MRLVRNNGYLKARQRAGRMMVLAGLLGLLVAVVTPFLAPTNYTIGIMGYFVLIVAFIFFNAGLQQTTKWSRMRPDRALDDALRRLNDKYTLIHFPEVPGTRPEHVLVYPGGLVVLTTREVAGQIVVENDRWRRRGGRLLRIFFMGGPPLGNPTAECRAQQQALRAWLEARDLPGAD
ncbi:MAG: NERD domain-containing protein, partial [Thermomicrobiaceae bacterium]|nr:NERD domain-containing protein [Thermomicrobiaceae bacterium]